MFPCVVFLATDWLSNKLQVVSSVSTSVGSVSSQIKFGCNGGSNMRGILPTSSLASS